MGNKRYNRNSKYYTKRGDYRGGVHIENIPLNKKTEDPAKQDRENRQEVVDKIGEQIQAGREVKEVCKELAETPEIREKFEYLINSLSEEGLAKVFEGWYAGRKREMREVEKGR